MVRRQKRSPSPLAARDRGGSMRRGLALLMAICLGLAYLPGVDRVPAKARSSPHGAAATGAPQVTITPTSLSSIGQSNGPQQVILAASGFGPLEGITIRFGQADSATGNISNPLLSVSGMADSQGAISNLQGTQPIPVQTLPPPPAGGGGLYTLQARGQTSGLVVNVAVSYPFLTPSSDLGCPRANVQPGQPFTVTGAGAVPNSTVVATANFPTPQEYSALADGTGAYGVTFTPPQGSSGQGYTVLTAALTQENYGYLEQLHSCTVAVSTTATQVLANQTGALIGAAVTVSGQGFGANELIQISLQYGNNGALSGTDVPGTARLAGNTDASGSFSLVYIVQSNVDALIAGTYILTAVGQQSHMVARTAFTVTEVATVQPRNAPPGTAVTVSAVPGSFSPGAPVTVLFNDPNPANQQGQQIATGTANVDGSFSQSAIVPLPASGGKGTIALSSAGKTINAAFYVGQVLTLNPPLGPPGTSVVVSGHGFGSNKSIAISLGPQGGVPSPGQQVSSSALGEITAVVTIPAQVQNGALIVSAADAQHGNQAQATFTVTGVAGPSAASTPTVTPLPPTLPTGTLLLPTGTPGLTLIPTAPPIATKTRTPTGTPGRSLVPFAATAPAGRAAPIQLRLSPTALDQGQVETVTVQAAPLTPLAYTVVYAGLQARAGGTIRTDSSGHAVWRFVVAVGPMGKAGWVQGTVSLRTIGPGAAGTATAYFAIYPALHLRVQPRLSRQRNQVVLMLSVQMARAGQVLASANLPGPGARRISARGNGDGRHPLLLLLPLGLLHGTALVRVNVEVRTSDGIVESQALSVVARS